MKVLDMTDRVFGNLTVVARAKNTVGGQAQWWVRCDCLIPAKFTVLGNNLRRGNTTGCPCTKRIRASLAMTKIKHAIDEHIESEMIGFTFGHLSVKSKHGASPAGTRWVCECSCGRDSAVLVRTTALKSGSRKACRLCSLESRKSLLPHQAMRNQLLIIYKAAARRRNYAWELTDAQFDALIQNACHYCGEPPSFRKDWKRFSDAFKCNGVDRMDNSLGYADANCVTACKDCNRMKGTMAYADFIAFLKKAGQFQMCGTEKAIVHAV